MDTDRRGIVLFGDVVRSRRVAEASTAWLATLSADLEEAYRDETLAGFEFTQGDELQGLLQPRADPFVAVARAALHPEALPMRWVVAAGPVDPGRGPATRRTGEAFIEARRLIELASKRRDPLLAVSGDERADALLRDMAPVLGEMLAGLRGRRREIARRAVVEAKRQSVIADELGIARATVSVAYRRAGIRSLERLLRATSTLFAEGVAARAEAGSQR